MQLIDVNASLLQGRFRSCQISQKRATAAWGSACQKMLCRFTVNLTFSDKALQDCLAWCTTGDKIRNFISAVSIKFSTLNLSGKSRCQPAMLFEIQKTLHYLASLGEGIEGGLFVRKFIDRRSIQHLPNSESLCKQGNISQKRRV